MSKVASLIGSRLVEWLERNTPIEPSARGRVDPVSTNLESLTRMLCEVTSLDELAGLVFEILDRRFGCIAARLWLRSSDDDANELELFSEWNRNDKPPSRRLTLAARGQVIGGVDIWDAEDPADHDPDALAELAPLLSLAFDAMRARVPHPTQRSAPPDDAQRIARLAENARDILCEISIDGRIRYVSPRVETVLGRPPASFVGRSFIEFMAPGERSDVFSLFAQLENESRPASFVFRAIHEDGSPRWLEATSRALNDDPQEDLLVCVLRDVTDRRREDEKQQRELERFRSLLEQAPDPVVLVRRDGTLLYGNPKARDAFGIVDGRVEFERFAAHIHPDDLRSLRHHQWPSGAAPAPDDAEFRYRRSKAEDWRWYAARWTQSSDRTGQGTYTVVLHDITHRKRLEETLRSVASELSTDDENFYSVLVRHLAETLDGCAAEIAICDGPDAQEAHTIAAWREGTSTIEAHRSLRGTPNAKLLEGELCCFPMGLRRLFPGDAVLDALSADSFIGCPLHRPDGRLVGMLACWKRGAIADPEAARSLIRILARRTETEIEHRRLVEALLVSEARYRTLAENARDIIVEISEEVGIEYLSPSVKEVLGYTVDEMFAMEPASILHPDDAEDVARQFVEMLRANWEGSLSFRVRHANGGWRWLDTRARTRRGGDGRLRVVAAFRDISERARAEQEREQLISMIQSSSDLIALVSRDGALLFLNAAGRRLIGVADDDAARESSFYDFLEPSDAREMRFVIMPTVHRRERWSGALRLRNLTSGRTLDTVANLFLANERRGDSPAAIAIMCRDVSERVKAEQRLIESEQRYMMLAENPYDLVSELDEHCRFIYVSPNFADVLGYSAADLRGTSALEIVNEEERDLVRQGIQRALDDEGTSHGRFRVRDLDGNLRWVETTARAYRTAEDRVMAVLISRDITRQVEANQALKKTAHELQQSQKMEAIGRLAGGIAHDFNNLLTAITGYCDLLIEELSDQHPAREDAEEILKASERAADLTHQLLAFSRRQVLQPRILDPNALVSDMDRMLRRMVGDDVELESALETSPWPIKADPGQIQQVLMNLVVNARDAMPHGGRISIGTKNVTIPEAGATGAPADLGPGRYLAISVRDTGEGMDPMTQTLIFEPFYTTKESGKGTGLGLSTVFGIVQQSGGHIRVASRVGLGSTFTLFFPRADDVAVLPEPPLEPGEFSGSETILLVEDSEPVRRLVERYLTRIGYTVLTAGRGDEALELCERHDGPIDLLLTDVVLPRMDGCEIAQSALEQRPEMRVIYMSGFSDEVLSKHGIAADNIALLEKPFTPSTLLHMIRRNLDRDVHAARIPAARRES